MLHSDGNAILVLKTPTVHQFLETLEADYGDLLGEELIDILDRGRRNNKQHLHDRGGWTNRLQEPGFDVVDCHTGVTSLHAGLWDIDLRPVSPHLIKMAYSLEKDRRTEIKEDWLDTWWDLLKPLCDTSVNLDQHGNPPELIYILE